MRLLGLDYGRKRIGLAISDPLGLSAQPLGFILNDSKILDRLLEVIRTREVSEIVLGHPRSLSGKLGEMAREVEAFAEKLKERTTIPLHLWDERFSTSEAENLLVSADVRRDKRKEVRDTVAASLILQGFMESRRG
ncbi:MAG: Holliday junction resolvase RuvX [Pseudomonadota bacterium]